MSTPPTTDSPYTSDPAWLDRAGLTDNQRLLAGLAYVSQIFVPIILPAILLLSEETNRDRFLRYHALHGLALLAVSVLYYLGAVFVYLIAAILSGCLACLVWIIFLPPLAAMVYYGWKAFTGHAPEVPWLTRFMRGNGWL